MLISQPDHCTVRLTFIILLIVMIPLTLMITGTSLGVMGAIVNILVTHTENTGNTGFLSYA